MRTEYINKTSDSAKYETWKPKIEAAQARQKASVVADFLLPESEIPDKSRLCVTNVPYETSVMSKEEIAITETKSPELVAKLAKGELTAKQVLTAFLKRATIAHQLVNCATEFMAEDAYKLAEELDSYYKETGKTKGPLHGIPVSIKEHLSIKGKVTTAGYVALLDNIPEEDCVTVTILKNMGAIPFVRTNVPQSLMHQDTTNYIYGTTVNSFNRNLSPSGSSGGEGALVGFKGSVLGMGTDIGGSIRSPAAFNGCYGLRATSSRISYRFSASAGAGQESIKSAIGPLAQHIEDIELFMSSYIASKPWKLDATLVHLPWKKVVPTKNFTVGIMKSDSIVKPHPPIARGLDFVMEKLEKAGITVVEFEPYKCDEIWEIASTLYFCDGCQSQEKLLAQSGEPLHPLTSWAFSYGKGEISVAENHSLNARRDSLRNEYQELMDKRGVDFILAPAYGGVAAEVGTTQWWNYCALWNLLDQPGLVFPTGLYQDPKIDVAEKRESYWGEDDEREAKKYADPAKFEGAPIALQLVARRYEDEELVAAGKVISEILGV